MAVEVEIVDRVMSKILSGKYKAHERLPSENEIADQFGVPRMTARKAYEKLEELGYVYKKQGKGSYVKDRSKQIKLVLSGDVSFSQKMIEQGYNFQSKNIFCRQIRYCKMIYDYLKSGLNDRVFKIGRLRLIDDQPIALHISYVSKSVFEDIDKDGINITSMFQYFNSKGYTDLSSNPSSMSVFFPTETQRRLLGCTSLVPLLSLQSGCVDKKTGTILEYRKILYRSDCFSYILP